MKTRQQINRARPTFYMISDNCSVSLGIIVCSLYIRCIALKVDYHKTRMGMLAFTPVELKFLETPAKSFIFCARENQFF